MFFWGGEGLAPTFISCEKIVVSHQNVRFMSSHLRQLFLLCSSQSFGTHCNLEAHRSRFSVDSTGNIGFGTPEDNWVNG